ncbi:MAG TPA: DUF5317 domain-containing protein [Patescibacteria group bacterium]|jgi:hypothetical protein|nr:DUF5317 domain-containing protein [Patescibacteria group bacterium]
MFILYALVVGFVLGLLLGGRPSGLANLQFRWPWLIIGGLLVQVVLFSDQVARVVGELGPWIYVGSTGLVFLGVLRNIDISGMKVVALGAASNLAAIVANGGYMPASRGALEALGKTDPTTYSNSATLQHPALEPLTDIFALPAWLPFANIFSVGDVLIALGVVVVIVAAMRRGDMPAPAAPEGSPVAS